MSLRFGNLLQSMANFLTLLRLDRIINPIRDILRPLM